MMISCSAIATGGFTQYYNGPTTIIKGFDKQLPEKKPIEKEVNEFEQHFHGKTTVTDPVEKVTIDIKSIPDWVLIEELERRKLILPTNYNYCTEKYNKWLNCFIENELCD